MASGNIRGITIELSGDTTNLESALNRVNTESKSLQSELKAVERGLKFDPGNVELVRQRQELLTQSISDTSQRLDILRTAQAQVQRQYDAGEIPVDQYRAFQRELQVTENSLNRLQGSLNSIDGEQQRLGESTRALGTLFDATGTNVNDFASALGSRLTSAIRDGSASADQLDRAIRIVGQNALGASTDIDQLRTALRQIDDGGSIRQVRQDLSRIASEANEAGDAVNGFGDQLTQVAGALAAGGGIAGIISQALDVSRLDTQIEITLDVPEESRNAVREAVLGLQAYGVEGEEALEGVRRQFVLNREATDEANAATVRYAGVIANAYSDIDFKELIQESNEIASSFRISNDEALGLVNSLLRVGFPPDQLDIIAEYGSQLQRAGFTAEEIQATFAAGVDTGTFNIDQLLDGLQEGRLRLTGFTQGITEGALQIFGAVGITGAELVSFGDRIAKGGADGRQAYIEVAQAIEGIGDATLREAAGVEVFGTLYEQNGALITQTLLGAEERIVSLSANQETLNQNVATLDASPAVLLSTAMTDLQTALKPVLDFVAVLLADIATWVSENLGLVAALTAVATTLGILAGAFVVIAPAIGGLVTALPVLTTAFAAISAPILIVIGAITALGAAFVALYASSETFRNGVNAGFESIREVALNVFGVVADFVGEQLQRIQEFWATNGQQILQAAENVFNGIMAVVDFVMPAIQFVIQTVWSAIKDIISGSLDIILGLVQVFGGVFTGNFNSIWDGIKQIFSGAIDFILGLTTLTFFGGIRTAFVNIGRSMIQYITTAWTGTRAVFRSGIDNILSYVNGFKSSITNQFKQIGTGIVNAVKNIKLFEVGRDVIRGLVNGIKDFASAPVDAIRDIGSKMISGISQVLGRRSPAREFIAIGKDVDAGLQIGIERNSDGVVNAMEDVGVLIMDVASKNASEVSKIAESAEKERTEIQRKYQEQRKKAQETSSKETQKTARDRASKLAKINSDEAAALKKINDKAFSDMQKKQEEVNKNTLDAIRKFVQDKKASNDISLIDEAEYYRAAYRQTQTGSDNNTALQKDYQNTVKQINDSITSVNNSFLSQTQKINDDLAKSESDLNKKYEDTLNARYNTLVNAYGLFEEVTNQDLVNPQTLIDNLNSQVNALENFQNNIDNLRNRGISGVLLEDLQDLGPKANAQLDALNRLTESELENYVSLYESRSRIARETATRELEPLANDTKSQIENLRKVANDQLNKLNTEWEKQIRKVVTGTDDQLKTLSQVGRNAGQSLLDGLSSVEGSLLNKAQQIARGISDTINSALNLSSSSTVNLQSNASNLNASSQRLASAVGNAQSSLNSSSAQSTNNQTARTVAAQNNNSSTESLVAAINSLANRPVQTSVQLNDRTIASAVSNVQYNNVNYSALQRGVNIL